MSVEAHDMGGAAAAPPMNRMVVAVLAMGGFFVALYLFAHNHFSALNPTRPHCPSTRNAKHIFNRHQKGFVYFSLWHRNAFINF